MGFLYFSMGMGLCLASEDFLSYDDSAEPIATEEEATQAVR